MLGYGQNKPDVILNFFVHAQVYVSVLLATAN